MVSSEPEKMHYPSQCGINPSAMHKIQTFTDRQPLIDKDSWYTLSLEKGENDTFLHREGYALLYKYKWSIKMED